MNLISLGNFELHNQNSVFILKIFELPCFNSETFYKLFQEALMENRHKNSQEKSMNRLY